MRSHPPSHGLCLVRLESRASHTLIAVVTDYHGISGREQRTHFLDDVDGATEAVRTYLRDFLTASHD